MKTTLRKAMLTLMYLTGFVSLSPLSLFDESGTALSELEFVSPRNNLYSTVFYVSAEPSEKLLPITLNIIPQKGKPERIFTGYQIWNHDGNIFYPVNMYGDRNWIELNKKTGKARVQLTMQLSKRNSSGILDILIQGNNGTPQSVKQIPYSISSGISLTTTISTLLFFLATLYLAFHSFRKIRKAVKRKPSVSLHPVSFYSWTMYPGDTLKISPKMEQEKIRLNNLKKPATLQYSSGSLALKWGGMRKKFILQKDQKESVAHSGKTLAFQEITFLDNKNEIKTYLTVELR